MGYLSTNAYGRVFNTCSQLCAPLCAGAAAAVAAAVAGLMLSSFNVAAGQSRKRGVERWGKRRGLCVGRIIFILTQNAALNATN